MEPDLVFTDYVVSDVNQLDLYDTSITMFDIASMGVIVSDGGSITMELSTP